MAKRPRSSKLPKIGFFSSLRFKFAFTMALFSGLLMLSVIFLLEQNFRDDKICAELVLQLKHFVYGSGSALTIAEAKQLLASINSKQARVWPWQKRVDFSLNHRRVP